MLSDTVFMSSPWYLVGAIAITLLLVYLCIRLVLKIVMRVSRKLIAWYVATPALTSIASYSWVEPVVSHAQLPEWFDVVSKYGVRGIAPIALSAYTVFLLRKSRRIPLKKFRKLYGSQLVHSTLLMSNWVTISYSLNSFLALLIVK